MTIRNRLKLIALVPIMLLLMLSTYFFVTSYINYEKAKALKTALENNAYISKGLLDIEKERGLSALYMGSDRTSYKELLQRQRFQTDSSLKTLQQKLVLENKALLPFLPPLLDENINLNTSEYRKLLNNLKKLPTIRKEADDPNGSFRHVFFDGYTKTISDPMMHNLLQVKNFTLDAEIASLASTLMQLYTV